MCKVLLKINRTSIIGLPGSRRGWQQTQSAADPAEMVCYKTVNVYVLLQVLDDDRIKHYFESTDMKKQVCPSRSGACNGRHAKHALLADSCSAKTTVFMLL
jgi:hypothetical protein